MVTLSTDRITTSDTDVATDSLQNLPALTENAQRVLRARYLEKDESGRCTETPDDLFDRVAQTMADVEAKYGGNQACRSEWKTRFKRLMTSNKFMPNSPTLMNAGRSMGMLSACFVLPVPDSIDGIFDSIKHTALIQKAGGGTGFAFDQLRPTGDYIKSSGGTTSGPISFWRAFSEATNAIQQGAFRRGANMGMMYIHHPDILKFLFAKQDLTQFTNYNISVKMTDEWMESFLRDPKSPHLTRNPRNGQEFYIPRDIVIKEYGVKDLIRTEEYDGQTPVYTRQDIWDIIVKHAWQTGEPGVVFIDRINEANPTPHVGRIEATNPCGEQPLLPYEACNLGSINLGLFVKNECSLRADVDWDALRETVHETIRFLDNVIDANNYPLPQIHDICTANRKIGLGIMGFADALYKLGVPYNSEAGVAWGERFMKFVNDESHNYSEKLAIERGHFPNWANSHWDTKYHRPMRNSCSTTVAPTGTISIIADCSGGIEPMFSLAFFRNVLKGQDEGKAPMIEINRIFEKVARERGFYSEGLMDRIAREGTLAHIDGIPEDVKRTFVCAHDIRPEWHVRMQAAFQRHCDSSISKTINFAHDANPDDVEKIYRAAYELRCKGVTVYRDGCRSSQPMALADSEKKHKEGSADAANSTPSVPAAHSPASVSAAHVAQAPSPVTHQGCCPAKAVQAAMAIVESPAAPDRDARDDRPRIKTETNLFGERITILQKPVTLEPKELPAITSGIRVRQQTPFGNMHIQITVDPRTERELEVFAQLGKGGDIANSDLEAICRIISLWLRAGGSLMHVIKQLSGIGSHLQIPTRDGKIMSLGDGLAQALKRFTKAKERHGLRALLLGEIDPADIEKPRAATPRNGNGNGHDTSSETGVIDHVVAIDHTAIASRSVSDRDSATSGNGHDTAAPTDIDADADSDTVFGMNRFNEMPAGLAARSAYRLKCPECGGDLDMGEGCTKCHACGYAQC